MDGTWRKSDQEKADVFRSHLKQGFQSLYDINDKLFTKHVENSLSTLLPLYLAPKPYSTAQVHH